MMTDVKSLPVKGSGRSTRARLARAAGATAAVAVVIAGGTGVWFYRHLNHNISTFDPSGIASSRPPAAVPVPAKSGGTGDSVGGPPVNVLVLGSDSRANGNDSLGGGEVGVGNSDTAILLHVYGDHRHAVAVSIPRDTLVTIPSCRLPSGHWTTPHTNQMFNSAFTVGEYAAGNPACSQNTVETLTGLRIDHTVVVDFKGFAAMTDAVHGVDVCVPNDVDAYGIKLGKGRQTVSGQAALDYVRARHGFGDGSDIGRVKRQQAFLSSLFKKVQGQGFDLTTLLPLADAATKSLTVDPGLGSALKLADFAQSLRDIKLNDITFVTAPWRYDGERVRLVQPDAGVLWNLLRQDRTLDGLPAPAPSTGATAGGDPTATTTATQATSPTGDPTTSAATSAMSSPTSAPTSSPTSSAAALPSSLPTGITTNARNAGSDLCSDLSFG
ncbi:LCP family protein [Kitasatospora sp. MAP5-34]|uniref:LCP family protein n=1 Tax=Kitasatospora sp. MAP5-34 TaxID=3035102 RepID=UPI002473DFFD|nr:LCP family protein [Kitasatospora sp. MAP5-34]MDH6574869.1 LCP family protein required for cell wall assembly [Kitasatospora sp. MAP5-34]